jgi:hypothetical protein
MLPVHGSKGISTRARPCERTSLLGEEWSDTFRRAGIRELGRTCDKAEESHPRLELEYPSKERIGNGRFNGRERLRMIVTRQTIGAKPDRGTPKRRAKKVVECPRPFWQALAEHGTSQIATFDKVCPNRYLLKSP